MTGDGVGAVRMEPLSSRSIVSNNTYTGTGASTIATEPVIGGSVNCNNVGDNIATNTNIRFGQYDFWVDATGDVRILSGERSTDTDGTVVGTQT